MVGTVFGQWVMGIDLTILSLFGFFGMRPREPKGTIPRPHRPREATECLAP